MNILPYLILSVIEGITEFLPISSTGHLILAGRLLSLEPSEFNKSFEIFIQFGAILAVLTIYWRNLIKFDYLKNIIISFLPTALIGFLFYKTIKDNLLENAYITVISLLIGGILLIIMEKIIREKNKMGLNKLNYQQAILIGLFQSISVIPGISRSAATIIGGVFTGLSRKSAVEYSFFLAVPTMLAATTFDLIKSNLDFSQEKIAIFATGFIFSFITAFISVKFFISFINRNNFIPFGVYRIMLATFYFIFFL